jgi:hypothetical protein
MNLHPYIAHEKYQSGAVLKATVTCLLCLSLMSVASALLDETRNGPVAHFGEAELLLPAYEPHIPRCHMVLSLEMTFPEFTVESHARYGDFVILTDGSRPRSFRAKESPRNKAATSG